MDFWPSLRILFRRAPSWITNISKEMERLKTLEDGLWLRLLNEAKHAIAAGSAKSSEYLYLQALSKRANTKSREIKVSALI